MREKLVQETAPVVVAPPSAHSDGDSYTPAVGDVVEFEYACKAEKGIMFKHRSLGMSVAGSRKWYCYLAELGLSKTGHVDDMAEIEHEDKAIAIAKAYFAKQEKAEYKVGDLVEGCWFGKWYVGEITVANTSDIPYEVKGNNECHFVGGENIRPLSGSYEERQAKWVEFYDIKVGDKVKGTRQFGENEDGSAVVGSKGSGGKGSFIRDGAIGSVRFICDGSIDVDYGDKYAGLWTFPYFALEPVK